MDPARMLTVLRLQLPDRLPETEILVFALKSCGFCHDLLFIRT